MKKAWKIFNFEGAKEILISMLAIAFAVFLWFLTTYLGWIKPLFLPSPQELIETVIELVSVGYRQISLQTHFIVSLARALFAFAMAGIIGIPMGLLMGFFPVINAILDPFVQFFRPLPKLALIPLVTVSYTHLTLPTIYSV